jgi:phenylacetate-coenzyme A ligase PaaK-like adenylate-forming protein
VVEARADTAAQPGEAALLGAKLKDLIGISARIDIVACGSLPRSAGKARHVRDRR